MYEIVRDWEILSTGPGGLAMGLQETLRRTRAPNTTHAAPRNAPAAHPNGQSPSTPVLARGGECVLGREARRGGHGAGAVRRGPRRCVGIGAAAAVAATAARLLGRPAAHSPVWGKGGG